MNQKLIAGITFIIDDRQGLDRIGPHRLGFFDFLESSHSVNFLTKEAKGIPAKVSFLVAGSWYDAFRHQGGYIMGTADLVETLTWNVKACFFSTPAMPVQTALSKQALKILQTTNRTQ